MALADPAAARLALVQVLTQILAQVMAVFQIRQQLAGGIKRCGTIDPGALRLLTDVMGSDNIMLGSDYPYPLGEQRIGSLVKEVPFYTAQQREDILENNARKFFGLN